MERIEWSRIWRENAPDTDKPRILFIGDSIIEGAKTKTIEKLRDVCNVSVYSSSRDVSDPYLFEEVKLLSKQENDCYKLIYLNNGLHTGGLSKADYKSAYETLIKKLSDMTDAKICLGLSTPVTSSAADAGKWDTPVDNGLDYSDVNSIVLEFNEAVTELAGEYDLPMLDLYKVVDGNAEIRTPDGYHYKPEGNELISDALSAFIKNNI